MVKVPDIAFKTPHKSVKKISWEVFEKKYLTREGKYKYESRL